MQIVLSAKFSPYGNKPIGGVQTWMLTVQKELQNIGHEVKCWQPGQKISGRFDLGIIAHIGVTRPILNFCKRSILISHGIIGPEKPECGCDVTAFTSEEVRNHWKAGGPIIRQPIDLGFWTPDESKREWITRYSYRTAHILYASGYKHRHIYKERHITARQSIRGSACVYASGRGALEAMACNVPVLIYDNRAYQGPLMGPRELRPNMENNYSGRGGFVPTRDDVDQETLERIEVMDNPRAWIQEHHDSRNIVKQIMEMNNG